jgi:hypothetical protein
MDGAWTGMGHCPQSKERDKARLPSAGRDLEGGGEMQRQPRQRNERVQLLSYWADSTERFCVSD